MSEEINEALLEGESANNWAPGAWTNTPAYSDEEYQPDIEPPRVNDYSAFKKHKHYRQYFRPYRYVAFPAWVYHATLEPRLIDKRNRDGSTDQEACKREVLALGPEWSPIPTKPRADMTGKSHPVKSETVRLAEVIAQSMPAKQGPIDASMIASIVAAVMAATQKPSETPNMKSAETLREFVEAPEAEGNFEHGKVERLALIELAEKEGIKIDKRWSNSKIKEALGI